MVCVVSAVSNETPHLVSLDGKTTFQDRPETDIWEPTNLVFYKGRMLQEVDFMSLDHDELWVVSDRVREALVTAPWCRFVRVRAKAVDSKKKPSAELDAWVMEVVRNTDVVDRSRTRFKPYGEFVLDLDTPGATVLDASQVPDSGIFGQPSGRTRVLMSTEAWQDMYMAYEWTGLVFKAIH